MQWLWLLRTLILARRLLSIHIVGCHHGGSVLQSHNGTTDGSGMLCLEMSCLSWLIHKEEIAHEFLMVVEQMTVSP